MVKDEMAWDLSQMVDSTNPSSVQEQLTLMAAESEKLRDRYHGKISNFNAESVLKLLQTRDSFRLRFEGTVKYCQLMYSANSLDYTAKHLNDASRQALMKAGKALAFIEIELGKLLASKPSLAKDPILAEYKHYLERIARRVPHMLSEAEEQVIIVKDKNGISSWEQFQSDWLSTRTFTIKVKGKKKTLPYGQIIGFYQSPDRSLRRSSNEAVYEELGKDEIAWASALRALCDDHIQMCELRKWASPMTQSLIDNDVDQQTIDSLMKSIKRNVSLYRRYLKLKAKLMGLRKLANYDIMAPLPKAPEKSYRWADARREVTGAYGKFDRQMSLWVEEMYERRHIDGKVRKGKTSGAWCSSWLKGRSAYILQSFNGKIEDLYTQAHELGHAVHNYLASRAQKPTNCDTGSCAAETGSIFGELLLTEHLLAKARTKEERQTILANILNDFGIAAFQVSARVFFEQSLYDSIKQGQFLDGKTIARLWVKARDSIYGETVNWLDVMKWEWTMKPHYYLANYRFYNYPYVFAQLFVFALYKLYKEQGKSFVPRFKQLLAAGSSKSPRELASEIGFDIAEETFWEKGMLQAKEFVDLLEETLE
jgi:oligoendopeptidase F